MSYTKYNNSMVVMYEVLDEEYSGFKFVSNTKILGVNIKINKYIYLDKDSIFNIFHLITNECKKHLPFNKDEVFKKGDLLFIKPRILISYLNNKERTLYFDNTVDRNIFVLKNLNNRVFDEIV